MQDRLDCCADPDGTFVITSTPAGADEHPPQVVARVYDPEYALVMTKGPALLGALKWVRTLLAQHVCHCPPGVRECVVCVTDDLLAEIDQGTMPPTQG
jgi:hypothetical protein